jgi:Uroporphyrinogen-III decarboxylase
LELPTSKSRSLISSPAGKPLLEVLGSKRVWPPPFWLMRQAGRYLPEYQKLRSQGPSFLDFCLTPELAAEATLQPIRRFGMDAAILFSDILVVPHALGQKVAFHELGGPVLDPIRTLAGVAKLDPVKANRRWQPVLETISLLGDRLPDRTTLIGFAGAPWTVSAYMIEGQSSHDCAAAKAWAYRDREDLRSCWTSL